MSDNRGANYFSTSLKVRHTYKLHDRIFQKAVTL